MLYLTALADIDAQLSLLSGSNHACGLKHRNCSAALARLHGSSLASWARFTFLLHANTANVRSGLTLVRLSSCTGEVGHQKLEAWKRCGHNVWP